MWSVKYDVFWWIFVALFLPLLLYRVLTQTHMYRLFVTGGSFQLKFAFNAINLEFNTRARAHTLEICL